MNKPLSLSRRGVDLRPTTLDREARTVEAIASTGADVRRIGFTERLVVSGADLRRLVGAPLLNAHRQSSVSDAIGVVEAARREGGAITVRLKFSRRAEADAVLDDIEDGVLRGVSIGYTVDRFRTERGANGEPIRIVEKFTPLEASLVPVPADPGATIRSINMPEAAPIEQPNQPPAVTPQATDIETPPTATETEVRSLAQIANLDDSWVETQTQAGATIDAARAAAFDAMAAASRPAPIRTARAQVLSSNEDPGVIATRIGEALFARTNPSHELSDPARHYAGLTLPEIGRDILRRSGIATSGMSAATVVTRALHTTSDFSLILGDTVGRTLRAAYGAVPSGVQTIARRTTAMDFRKKHRLQLGEFPTLERVNEHGEFSSGSMAEAGETYRVETFGRIIGISRQAMVNDDLSAFTDLSARIGVAARAFEAAQLVEKLEANPVMSDGEALFAAAHGNLADPTGVPSETSLSAARLSMRKQTGLSGDLIAVTPRYVLVPAELETATEKLLSDIQANRTDDANPFSTLSLIVDPRLNSESAWYVAADPAQIDGLEYAYLAGAEGPQTESRNGFEIDGVQVKVRLDFGCGFVDWRGWHRNAGA